MATPNVFTWGGGLFGGKNKQYRRYREQAFRELDLYRQSVMSQYEDILPTAMQEQGRALEAVRGGYGKAQEFAKQAFKGAEGRVFESEKKGIGDIIASQQRGGLTTNRAALRRGLRSDTQRSLMDISDLLQRTQGQLAVGQGSAEASIYGQLLGTQLKQQRNVAGNRIHEQRLAFLTGLMSGGPPTASQEMAQFGFDLAGTAVDAFGAFG